MPGQFHDFRLDFSRASGDAEAQAVAILTAVRQLHEAGAPMVGITYSANGNQTTKIRTTYKAGGWRTGTSGANQATVISHVERLLKTPAYADLRTVFRIIPITTMIYQTGSPAEEVRADITAARTFLRGGGHILGWKNQGTSAEGVYAIGGGVTNLRADVEFIVNNELPELKRDFSGDPIDGTKLKSKPSSTTGSVSGYGSFHHQTAAAAPAGIGSGSRSSHEAPLLDKDDDDESHQQDSGCCTCLRRLIGW